MAGGETQTFVGNKPSDPPVQPLPPLRRTLPDPGFTFIPVSADYTALIDEAKRGLKVGETQTFEVPGKGVVKVVFKDVDIYQTTGKQLAIGVTLDAASQASVLNTRGTVWLTTSANIDNEGKRVKVEKLEVYSQSDNAPIDLLVSIIQLGPVNRAIREALEYDFSRNYDDMLKQANAALKRQISDDFYVVGKLDSFGADGLDRCTRRPRSRAVGEGNGRAASREASLMRVSIRRGPQGMISRCVRRRSGTSNLCGFR